MIPSMLIIIIMHTTIMIGSMLTIFTWSLGAVQCSQAGGLLNHKCTCTEGISVLTPVHVRHSACAHPLTCIPNTAALPQVEVCEVLGTGRRRQH